MTKRSLFFWRATAITAFLLSILAIGRIISVVQALHISLFLPKWLALAGFFGLTALAELAFFGLTWNQKVRQFLERLGNYFLRPAGLRAAGILAAVLLLVGFAWSIMFSPFRGFLMNNPGGTLIVLGPQNGDLKMVNTVSGTYVSDNGLPVTGHLVNSGIQWWEAWVCVMAGAILLKISRKNGSLEQSFFAALLGLAFVYKVFTYFPLINSFPYSLYWAEGGRWYYASLVASARVYGSSLPPSFIDYPLDIVNSLPYFLGAPSILAMRTWSAILLLGGTLMTAISLAWRLHFSDRWLGWVFTAAAFLFLFQESTIYPHLLLAVIIVLLFSSSEKTWAHLLSSRQPPSGSEWTGSTGTLCRP